MSRPTAPANAGGLPSASFISLAYVGRMIGVADADRERFHLAATAARQAGKLSAEIYYDHASRNAAEIGDALRDALSVQLANSLEEALLQMAQALAVVEHLQEIAEERDELTAKRLGSTFDRLQYSAIRAVQVACGKAVAVLASEDLAAMNCDPWEPVEAKLTALRKQNR